MPLYYSELKQPPAFGRMLPGAVGYKTPAGALVMYGPRPKDPVLEGMIDRALSAKPKSQSELQSEYAEFIKHHISHYSPRKPFENPCIEKIKRVTVIPNPPKRAPIVGFCPICEESRQLTLHHVIPRAIYNNPGRIQCFNHPRKTIRLCRPCHTLVHERFTNEQLATTALETVLTGVRAYKASRFDSK